MAAVRLFKCLLLYLASGYNVLRILQRTERSLQTFWTFFCWYRKEDSESLSNLEEEEELELLFLDLAYQPKRDKTQILSIDGLTDLDFELLFRQVTYITGLGCCFVMMCVTSSV